MGKVETMCWGFVETYVVDIKERGHLRNISPSTTSEVNKQHIKKPKKRPHKTIDIIQRKIIIPLKNKQTKSLPHIGQLTTIREWRYISSKIAI